MIIPLPPKRGRARVMIYNTHLTIHNFYISVSDWPDIVLIAYFIVCQYKTGENLLNQVVSNGTLCPSELLVYWTDR